MKLASLTMQMNQTRSSYVKQALLEKLEDLEDAALADERWEKVLAGEALYTHEEVLAKLGLT